MSTLADRLPPLITVPAGSFLMGTPDTERSLLAKRYGGTRESYAEESPQHTVFVPAFAMAQVPVTNALYASFQAATGAHKPITWGAQLSCELWDHPVVDVSWHDAQLFCAWISAETGRSWRLPTESEWEKAARGTDRRVFPWGNAFDPTRCNVKESELGSSTPVARYPTGASPYGIWDMAGNAWEWTQSLQSPYPYAAHDGRNASAPGTKPRVSRFLQRVFRTHWRHTPPTLETRRILRGGCYANPEGFARCACRLRLAPERRTPFLGFRLACDL